MVENKYAGSCDFTFDKSLQGGAEENEQEQEFSQRGFGFEPTEEERLGENILGGQESGKTGKQSDLFELNYGSVLTSNPASDGEIFYPDLFYRDHIKVNMTPAVPSLPLRDSAAHRRAADVLNHQYFPGIFAKPEEISKDYGFPTPKQPVERSPRSNLSKISEKALARDLAVGIDTIPVDEQSDVEAGRLDSWLAENGKSEYFDIRAKASDDGRIRLSMNIPSITEPGKIAQITLEDDKLEELELVGNYPRYAELQQKRGSEVGLTAEEAKEYEGLKLDYLQHDVISPQSVESLYRRSVELENLVLKMQKVFGLQKLSESTLKPKQDENGPGYSDIMREIVNLERAIKLSAAKLGANSEYIKKMANKFMPESGTRSEEEKYDAKRKLHNACRFMVLEAAGNPNKPMAKGALSLDQVLQESYDELYRIANAPEYTYNLSNNLNRSIFIIGFINNITDNAGAVGYPMRNAAFAELHKKVNNLRLYPEFAEKMKDIENLPGENIQQKVAFFIYKGYL